MAGTWRDDPRFQCPRCREPIRLKWIKEGSSMRAYTASPMVATCRDCGRAYTIEEWKELASTRKSPEDIDT